MNIGGLGVDSDPALQIIEDEVEIETEELIGEEVIEEEVIEEEQPIVLGPVCASAPGKVILFGEHAVVYGEPAVAGALSDLRVHVWISPSPCFLSPSVAAEPGLIHVQMHDLPIPIDFQLHNSQRILEDEELDGLQTPPTSECAEKIAHFLRTCHNQSTSPSDVDEPEALQLPLDDFAVAALIPLIYLIRFLAPPDLILAGLDIQVRSRDLPVGAGLGSSAAFGVASAAALVQLEKWWKETVAAAEAAAAAIAKDDAGFEENGDDGEIPAIAAPAANNNAGFEDGDGDIPISAPAARNNAGFEEDEDGEIPSISAPAAKNDVGLENGDGDVVPPISPADANDVEGNEENDDNAIQVIPPPPMYGRPDKVSLQRIDEYAYYSEILLHGTPSGVDNAVSLKGGALLYKKEFHPDGSSNGSTMTCLPHFPPSLFELMLVNTHVPRSTKELVAGVRQRYNQHTRAMKEVLSSIGHLSTEFCDTIAAAVAHPHEGAPFDDVMLPPDERPKIALDDDMLPPDERSKVVPEEIRADANAPAHGGGDHIDGKLSESLLSLVEINHHLLCASGVSHPSLDFIVETVKRVSRGAAAAKLTGAGGGGCAMVLLRPDLKDGQKKLLKIRIKRALEIDNPRIKEFQFSCFSSSVGGDGVLWTDPEQFDSEEDERKGSREKNHVHKILYPAARPNGKKPVLSFKGCVM